MAPLAGVEATGLSIAQVHLLGVDHAAAAGIRVVLGAAVGGNPYHHAGRSVVYIGQAPAGEFRLLGCSGLSGSLGRPEPLRQCWMKDTWTYFLFEFEIRDYLR